MDAKRSSAWAGAHQATGRIGEDGMGYSEALDQQMAALDWMRTPTARALFAEFGRRRGFSDRDTGGMVARSLEYGATYFWSREIGQFIDQAAAAMPDWTLTSEYIPSPSGFFWFEQPITLPHWDQAPADLTAISWTTIHKIVQEGYEGRPKVVPLPPGDLDLPKVFQIIWWVSMGARSAGMPVTIIPWEEGETVTGELRLASQHDMPTNRERLAKKLKVFAAALAFLQQEILVTTAERPVTATVRRAAHYRIEPTVRMVRLRRTTRPRHGAPVEVDWSCQWVVSGHWRQQWHPKTNRHQPKWIMPYVKGPEDKPLKPPRATVFAVVR